MEQCPQVSPPDTRSEASLLLSPELRGGLFVKVTWCSNPKCPSFNFAFRT